VHLAGAESALRVAGRVEGRVDGRARPAVGDHGEGALGSPHREQVVVDKTDGGMLASLGHARVHERRVDEV
jgi:hypothetical protein